MPERNDYSNQGYVVCAKGREIGVVGTNDSISTTAAAVVVQEKSTVDVFESMAKAIEV